MGYTYEGSLFITVTLSSQKEARHSLNSEIEAGLWGWPPSMTSHMLS